VTLSLPLHSLWVVYGNGISFKIKLFVLQNAMAFRRRRGRGSRRRRSFRRNRRGVPFFFFISSGSRRFGRRRRRGSFVRRAKRIVAAAAEVKSRDTTVTAPVTDSSTIFDLQLNSVPQGLESYDRVGNRISLKSLRIKLLLWYEANVPPTTGPWFHIIQAMVILVKNHPGGIATSPISLSEIFMDPSDLNSMYRPDTIGNYKVLYKRVFQINSIWNKYYYRKIFIRFRNRVAKFNGVAVTTMTTNSVHLIMRSNWPSATIPQEILCSVQARSLYTDA